MGCRFLCFRHFAGILNYMLIQLTCKHCFKLFERDQKHITYRKKFNYGAVYCSNACGIRENYKGRVKEYPCGNCNIPIRRSISQFNKSKIGIVFCSRSCSCSYHNSHKTNGYNRSKLEIWLESQLTTIYPNLDFKFNERETIGLELDIYLPSLKLAFELNGIFHFEAIFNEEKLAHTQRNDNHKFQACVKQNISLCVIDTSRQKNFKEKTSQQYLEIITNIIDSRNLATI